MSCRLAPQGVSLVHKRVQFRLGQLRNIDIVGGRKYTAAGARLDDVRPVLDVEAHGAACLFRIIDHSVLRPRLVTEQAVSKGILIVTVAASRPERMHRDQHARPRYDCGVMALRNPTSMNWP